MVNTKDNDFITRVMQAVEESMFGTENIGFCMSCGAERDGCEPDASGYECYECGEFEVLGAEEIMIRYL